MPQNPMELEKLKQGLMEDLSSAQEVTKQGEVGRGNVSAPGAMDPSNFSPKGIRISGKIVGQAELADARGAFNKNLEHYMENANFKNETEKQAFKFDLQKKFNTFQLDMLRQGAQVDYNIRQGAYDQAEKDNMISSFGQAVQGAVTMAAMQRPKAPGPNYNQMSADAGNQFNTNIGFDGSVGGSPDKFSQG